MAAYSLVYYLFPRYFLSKKYLFFVLGLLLSVYVFTVLARLSVVYLAEPFIRTDFDQETPWEIISDPIYLLAIYMPATYLVVFIFFALKNIKARFDEKHQMEVLQKEKANNELRFLKAQIHPHFLFNTLNNLYALTLEGSKKAPEVVLKLSEMLDYILYQCSEPSVPLAKEVTLIQHYIDLERLRYSDHLEVSFEHQIVEENTMISPLILLSIVENAFKHGVSKVLEKSVVEISLSLTGKQLKFQVLNSKPPSSSNHSSNDRKGIGSENIKRQLDLIYPNAYQLMIDDQPSTYSLSLEIEFV